EVWATDLKNPNFAEFASSCGALGIRVENNESLNEAMTKVMAHNGPALLEIITDAALI
ncbi:MAG: thiamine pyrophosphate-dependent acetolactate synthase large subunit-like protein, partial [Roseivirga sp.]